MRQKIHGKYKNHSLRRRLREAHDGLLRRLGEARVSLRRRLGEARDSLLRRLGEARDRLRIFTIGTVKTATDK